MDRFKFTRISHADLLFHSPISAAKLDIVLELAQLTPRARVADFGCGNAEVLVRLVERYQVAAVGVDSAPFVLAEAHQRTAERIPAGSLTLHQQEAQEYAAEPESLDLALGIGATHAFDNPEGTLRHLAPLVRPGGHLVVGEGFWKRAPDAAYLAALRTDAGSYGSHADNVALGVTQGLRYRYAAVTSDDDWHHFEGLYCRAVERYPAAHPRLERYLPAVRTRHAWVRTVPLHEVKSQSDPASCRL
jgi:SAM-dependent methyltransferase